MRDRQMVEQLLNLSNVIRVASAFALNVSTKHNLTYFAIATSPEGCKLLVMFLGRILDFNQGGR